MLSFEAGGLYAVAFEDMTRVGGSDQDFNDLIVTMTSTPFAGELRVLTEVPEPFSLTIALSAVPGIAWARA